MVSVWKKCCLVLALVFGLMACVDDQQLAEGGIGGTGISSGPISGFGSIIVNVIHFDVSQAQVWLNGQLASEQDLQHGMLVTVYGNIDQDTQTGVATDVVFNSSLTGLIESLDVDGQWLRVSGQRVNLDELTVLDGMSLAGVFIGMPVVVSGLNNAAGDWLATYIAFDQNSAAAAVASDSPAEEGGESIVQPKPLEQEVLPGRLVSLKGLIANVLEAQFYIQGIGVEINDDTRFENGAVTDIALNATVAVIGSVNDAGLVVADEISFIPAKVVRIAAQVESLNDGVVTLAGIAVRPNSSTLMLDSSVAAVRTFSFQDLAVGDSLVVNGFLTPEGIVLTRLQRFDSLPHYTISGPVGDFIRQPLFEVLGVTVDTSVMTGVDALFAAMSSGDWITVRGRFNGAVLLADEVVFIP